MQVNCLHPTLIYNPLLQELLSIHGNLHVNGQDINFYQSYKIYIYGFKPQNYLPSPTSVSLDNLDCYYVSDSLSGAHYPVFLQVPCGHCEICKNAKVNAFVDRCKLETQLYKSNPLFLTLTYDELHKKDCGVCLRDIQLFFKRLRINLYRKGYRESIRYALVSEYGKKTSRAHYHCILWNCHATDFLSYFEIREIIQKSWSNGFIMCRLVDPSNDKAFYYTAKYLRKDCDVPRGCNKTFMVCSNRGGGIGAAFIDNIRRKTLKYLNTEIKYVNKWNGRVYTVQANRYMLNRLCPTLSRSFPYSLKARVKRFVQDYHILFARGDVNSYLFDSKFDAYYQFFGKYIFVPQRIMPKLFDNRPSDLILREMLQDEIYLDIALNKGNKFFEDAVYYADRRDKYLLKLFAHVTEQDLVAKAYKVRRDAALAAQREIL